MLRLVVIGSLVLETNLFKCCQCIFAISLLSPIGEGCHYLRMLCVKVWLKLTRWFKEDENVKSLWTYGRADGRQSTTKVHLRLQLRWAKKCVAHIYILISWVNKPSITSILTHTIFFFIHDSLKWKNNLPLFFLLICSPFLYIWLQCAMFYGSCSFLYKYNLQR